MINRNKIPILSRADVPRDLYLAGAARQKNQQSSRKKPIQIGIPWRVQNRVFQDCTATFRRAGNEISPPAAFDLGEQFRIAPITSSEGPLFAM